MEQNERIYITINHLEDFPGSVFIHTGDRLSLIKEKNNPYDDEAIAVHKNGDKCAYVANSVSSVARGTCSAGRIYDLIEEKQECVVRFLFNEEGIGIGELL